MACFRLRSYDQSPRGGYFYDQYSADKKPLKSFGPEPVIETISNQVAAFRRGNSLPRASYKEAMEDVDHYQCRRLGNDPQFCIPCNSDSPGEMAIGGSAPGMGHCKGCGARV